MLSNSPWPQADLSAGVNLGLAAGALNREDLTLDARRECLSSIAAQARDLLTEKEWLEQALSRSGQNHHTVIAMLDTLAAGTIAMHREVVSLEKASTAWAVRSEAFEEIRIAKGLLRVMAVNRAALLSSPNAASYRFALTMQLEAVARQAALLADSAALGGD